MAFVDINNGGNRPDETRQKKPSGNPRDEPIEIPRMNTQRSGASATRSEPGRNDYTLGENRRSDVPPGDNRGNDGRPDNYRHNDVQPDDNRRYADTPGENRRYAGDPGGGAVKQVSRRIDGVQREVRGVQDDIRNVPEGNRREIVHGNAGQRDNARRPESQYQNVQNRPDRPRDDRPTNLRQGDDRSGNMWQGDDRSGNLRQGDVRPTNIRQGDVRPGNLRQGGDRPGNLRQGDVRPGNLRQADGRPNNVRQRDDRPRDERLRDDRPRNEQQRDDWYGDGNRGGPRGDGNRRSAGNYRKSRVMLFVNILLITLSVAVITVIIMLYNSSSDVLTDETVHEGVSVSGADVSDMSYDELVEFLNKEFGGSLDNKYIAIKVGDITEKYSFADLGVNYNIDEAAKQAYEAGRSGSGMDRMQKVSDVAKNPVDLHLIYTYDEDKVNALAGRIAEDAGVLSEDADVRYTASSVIISPGKDGVRIDKDDLADQLHKALDKFESAEIEVSLIFSPPEKLDAEKIYDTIYREPVDAYYKVSENRKSITIEAEVPGQSVDRERLSLAIESLNNNTSSDVTIPLVAVEASVKKEDLSGTFFQNVLGEASTNFSVNSTNNKNRRDNMALATQTITGYILAPGDEFDFNGIVGERREQNGYKMAGAFMNGQLIDDVGGGICQVSSTLYNAVLYADLSVTQRQNHTYLVSYVTKGFDATVSYPLPNFKFKNTSQHPIRVDCKVEGTTITFTILGTQVGPKKKITFSFEQRSSTDFNKVVTEDPTMPVGHTNVTQSGRIGYTIDTYKTVQIGDGPKETVKVATNKYKAMDQLETIGTAPLPPNASAAPTVVITPSPDDDDFISDSGTGAGQTQSGNNGTGEPDATNRPLRTPRPNRVSPTSDTQQGQQGTTTAGQTAVTTTAEQTTAAAGTTTAAATTAAVTTVESAEKTTAAQPTPPPATDGGGDANPATPKRTPRPASH